MSSQRAITTLVVLLSLSVATATTGAVVADDCESKGQNGCAACIGSANCAWCNDRGRNNDTSRCVHLPSSTDDDDRRSSLCGEAWFANLVWAASPNVLAGRECDVSAEMCARRLATVQAVCERAPSGISDWDTMEQPSACRECTHRYAPTLDGRVNGGRS